MESNHFTLLDVRDEIMDGCIIKWISCIFIMEKLFGSSSSESAIQAPFDSLQFESSNFKMVSSKNWNVQK